jgi:hypothetical protein
MKCAAATTDKAEHDFAATGIYPYRPNIITDEDSEPSEITRKGKMPDAPLEGQKTSTEMLTLPSVSMVLLYLHLPLREHLIMELLPQSTTHTRTEAVNPLPEASVEDKQRKRRPQESDILPGTTYRTCIESKRKEEVSKMKGNGKG